MCSHDLGGLYPAEERENEAASEQRTHTSLGVCLGLGDTAQLSVQRTHPPIGEALSLSVSHGGEGIFIIIPISQKATKA